MEQNRNRTQSTADSVSSVTPNMNTNGNGFHLNVMVGTDWFDHQANKNTPTSSYRTGFENTHLPALDGSWNTEI